MLFPVRDSIPSRTYPVVNTAVIVVCTVVFIYQLLLGPHLDRLLALAAFIPARLFDSVPLRAMPGPDYGLGGNLATMVASMFLHGGWFHIIGNMWFLYIFGDNVEDALGHFRYLLFYLGAGVAACVAEGLTHPASTVPMIGASGAIAAVLGAYTVWFPHSRVHTLVFLGLFITMAELPGVVFLGFWFLLQFFQGTLSLAAAQSAGGGVAWFAHIGGFLFGFVVALALKRSGLIRPAQPRNVVYYRA
jgi:membrane associated rhomboid family serine protease